MKRKLGSRRGIKAKDLVVKHVSKLQLALPCSQTKSYPQGVVELFDELHTAVSAVVA